MPFKKRQPLYFSLQYKIQCTHFCLRLRGTLTMEACTKVVETWRPIELDSTFLVIKLVRTS